MSHLARARRPDRDASQGQSLVEFAMIVTVMMLLLLGMLEFGFIFDQHLTLEYASREGARVGSALGNGTSTIPCAQVDQNVIAAVQRVATSPGSRVTESRISEIRIYKSTATGAQSGTSFNTWIYAKAQGPVVDGKALDFKSATSNWAACSRNNAATSPDSIGVRVSYTYVPVTPVSAVMKFFGGGGPATIPISDQTVMALNPSN